ncbi:MAG TPA: hypothetical protein VFY06_15440 [Verrucomicrobiae bacterium]|nr:hypothetical protein [Verrucomicrobiae bacterium]
MDPAIEHTENDALYPLMTYKRYGAEYRWQFFQLLSYSGGMLTNNSEGKRFTLFPIYFQQRSPDPNENYTAFAPFYGHLKNRLLRDRIFFVMFPLYSQTQKRDIVTDNYLFPIFDVQHGDGEHGWQFWPLFGARHKIVTTFTNGFGETVTNGGYEKYFALWPIHFWQDTGIGTDHPEKFRANWPLYTYTRSPQFDSTTVLWPFFTWIDQREKQYHEWQAPWPIVIFARGEGKTTSRVFPLFSLSHDHIMEQDSYLWPLYRHKEVHSDPLALTRNSVLFYLYTSVTESNTATGADKKRVAMWPFFTWHRDFNGNERLQILAPVEPALPNNTGVERNWSPLWSLWRWQHNPETGAASQSLLWNLYRRDTTPDSKKCSLLFGLFQYQSVGENKRLRLFYIPVWKTHQPAGQSAK